VSAFTEKATVHVAIALDRQGQPKLVAHDLRRPRTHRAACRAIGEQLDYHRR
jgi:hypothetical protein